MTTRTEVQALIETRAGIWSQMQEVLSRGTNGQLNADDATTYDNLDTEFERLSADIDRWNAHAELEAKMSAVDRTGVVGGGQPAKPANQQEQEYTQAFDAWMRLRPGMFLDANTQNTLQRGRTEIENAQGVGSGGAGGYTVPPQFRNDLIEQIKFFAAMRQYAQVITTDTGANLQWPTVDDTANEGAILAENTGETQLDVTFGTASLDAYMYSSKIVLVSLQLLQDSAFNLNAFLARALGARIGRIQNRHFTVGTGTGQPDGIITSATVGVTGTGSFATSSVSYDNLVDLTDSIDPAYINPNSRFMMSQATRKVLRKLKDGQNRPLWEPSLQVGTPDVLMGYGVALNNYMASPAVNAKAILFGDIEQAYVIRDVSDLTLMRLTERYADALQVGFLAFQRSDGTMQNTSAAKVFQMTATA